MVKKDILLTAVITAHSEGILAHKTMMSVFRSLKKLDEAGYPYEIIVHIDKGTEETKKYFKRYEDDPRVHIVESSFGDTGPSRNRAVELARGRYVSFLDADDLVSESWFIEALKLLEKSSDTTIACPSAVLSFLGYRYVLTYQRPSLTSTEDAITLLGENLWSSVLMARREVFELHPYRHLTSGYAHEDYAFNLEVLEAGYSFLPAPETVLFYRRSADSRFSSSSNDHATVPYTKLFDFSFISKIPYPEEDTQESDQAGQIDQTDQINQTNQDRPHSSAYKLYKKIRGNPFLNYFITPVAIATKKILGKNEEPHIEIEEQTEERQPDAYVLKAWREINSIDSELYPDEEMVKHLEYYDASSRYQIGQAYHSLSSSVHHYPDYVFLAPWIVRGGADKVLLNYIRALRELKPDIKITVITTLPVENTWASQLPENVDHIDFGNVANGLAEDERETLMTRLIVQLKCKNLHIINSAYAYSWVREHISLAKKYTINVSFFCFELIEGSNDEGVWSYDSPALSSIYPVVSKIFTDNIRIKEWLIAKNAFDEEKVIVHYQPSIVEIKERKKINTHRPLRILWASRIVRTKIPEIAAEIASRLDPEEYRLDAYGEICDPKYEQLFSDIPALHYYGTYDGFGSLPIDDADVFLYTSLSDGVPNVILEASAAGLPIIASNEGGVAEFIKDGKTGFLVDSPRDVSGYISALKKVRGMKDEELLKLVKNSQKLLVSQHSWESFKKNVEEDLL